MFVLKFGGTSVQNAEMMDKSLTIAADQIQRGPVMVASAMSKVTDLLQEIARSVGAGRSRRPWRSWRASRPGTRPARASS